MNQQLTEHIVFHILASLNVLPANFIDKEKSKSIIDKQFVLSEKILLEDENGKVLRNNVYGCQILVSDSKELKLLLADCTDSKEWPEYCLLVQLRDAPSFGIYMVSSNFSKEPVNAEAMIAVSVDKKNWVPCSTYLQATFLAGMEQLKDIGYTWSKCSNYQEQYQQLLSFIKFHHNFYEAMDER